MANKDFLSHQVMTDLVMTGTAVVLSEITNIRGMDDVFYEIQMSGTAVGTFTVQVSTSYDPISNPDAVFIPIVLDPVPVAAGADGQIGININLMGSKYIQLTYTNASGSGTMNAYISAKAV